MNMFIVMGCYTGVCFAGLIGVDYLTTDYMITNKTDDHIGLVVQKSTNVLNYPELLGNEQYVLAPHQYATVSVGVSSNMGIKTMLKMITASVIGRTSSHDQARLINPESHFLAVRRNEVHQLIIENFVH